MLNKAPVGIGSAVSFSHDDEPTQLTGSKSTARGKKGTLTQFKSASEVTEVTKRGRGGGRGSNSMKQTTLDTSMMFLPSERLRLKRYINMESPTDPCKARAPTSSPQ